ncbi:hypothetical protein VPNG_01631 [Cytospora leucostoma]|uniref:Uncharacterized protein n=1 Tax=Cytospora leucostoma TaxID=1230097 RepID=A0A423XKT6_9PEZI|nr:hypothetical protein VPNG_01631 [Cytospora leucostoma]
MVLAAGFGPFMQNLLHYYQKPVSDPGQMAYITNGSTYSSTGILIGGSRYYLDPVMKANIYSSLFNADASQPWADPKYVCASGNCTFPQIPTLTTRPHCTDISDRLNLTCIDCDSDLVTAEWKDDCFNLCTVSVPDGPSMNFTEGVGGFDINVTTSTNPLIYNDTKWLPAIQYIMVKDFEKILDHDYEMLNRSTKFVATECALQLCAEWVQDSVSNSTLSTNVQRSECGWDYQLNVTSDFAPNLTWQSPWSQFYLTYDAHISLMEFVADLFDGHYHTISDAAEWATNDGDNNVLGRPVYATIDTTQAIFYGDFSECNSQEDDHLTCAINNIAKAITKTFRDEAYINNGVAGGNLTIGQNVVLSTYVRIDWVWLTLPIAVWLAAAVLWMVTFFKTRRARLPTWRNNILPYLFLFDNQAYRRNEEDDAAAAGLAGVSNRSYSDESRKITARLQITSTGAKLE